MNGTVLSAANSWDEVLNIVASAKGAPGAEKLLWFRGQTDADNALLPKLLRYRNVAIEEPILFDGYDYLLPMDAAEKGLDWDRLFKMQHYNIPTRLLDWTESLGVAAFFAVDPDRQPPPKNPCIYILRPEILNVPIFLPNRGKFSYQEHYLGRNISSTPGYPPPHSSTLAILPGLPNERLRAQQGRFTIHSSNIPLDIELEAKQNVLWQIKLEKKAIFEIRAIMQHMGLSYRQLYPDFEGVAQWLTGRLEFVPNKAERDQILKVLSDQVAASYRNRNEPGAELGGLADISFCALDNDFLPREDVTAKLIEWMSRNLFTTLTEATTRHPILVLEGEAGSGKTNLLLYLITSGKLYGNNLLDQDRNAIAIFRAADFQLGQRTLLEQVLRRFFGSHRWNDMLDPVRYRTLNTWRKMVAMGEVVLVLDGLDELARLKGIEAVRRIDRELSELLEGEHSARIVVSCRTHVWRKLQSEGILSNAQQISIGQLHENAIEKYAKEKLEKQQFTMFKKLHKKRLGNVLLTHPLFLKMVVEMFRNESDDIKQLKSREELFATWFDGVLRKHIGVEDLEQEKMNVAAIAVCMLDGRSDAISKTTLENKSTGGLLWKTVERHSTTAKPGAEMAIFSVRQDTSDPSDKNLVISFTHQLLREFVLAWSLWKGIKPNRAISSKSKKPPLPASGEEKNVPISHVRDFISTTSAYDYEGAEMYSHLADLMHNDSDVLLKTINKTAKQTWSSPGIQPREEQYWNNRIRNLFECFGMVAAKDSSNSLHQRREGVEIALRLLKLPNPASTLRFRTKFNIVRCLCRLHPTSPTSQHEFISSVHWQHYLNSLEEHAIHGKNLDVRNRTGKKVWTIEHVIDAYAVRGFQRSNLVVHSRPPMAFVSPPKGSQSELKRTDVAACLVKILDELNNQKELPLDAVRLWLNCTFALIRWMPKRESWNTTLANNLMDVVFKADHTDDIVVRQAALNVFWTLYLGGHWKRHEERFTNECHRRGVLLGPVRFAFCKDRKPWPTLQRLGATRDLPASQNL